VWLRIEKYNLEFLPANTFEEVSKETEKQFLDNSILGYSTVRFVPKGLKGKMRRIINLKRVQNKVPGKRGQEKSVNTVLRDTFQVLTFEKVDMLSSDKKSYGLGGSVFNFNEIYELDVQCCFESIDQDQVLGIVKDVLKERDYAIHKYDMVCQKGSAVRALHNYYANSTYDFPDFPTFARELAQKRSNSIFVDRVREWYRNKEDILDLLEKHIKCNLIKIRDKSYRQCTGISQGSVVSTLLCRLAPEQLTFYYREMEWEVLPFVKHDDGVMLRFLDDFLYISTDKEKVERFITAMHKGHPKVKCVINREKSLTNLDIIIDGESIEKLSNTL
ncbi:3284_t:CDS:10, partial [Scutellospora calospora]